MNMPWIWIQTWTGICLHFNQLFVYFFPFCIDFTKFLYFCEIFTYIFLKLFTFLLLVTMRKKKEDKEKEIVEGKKKEETKRKLVKVAVED